jgi:hypothetical protein
MSTGCRAAVVLLVLLGASVNVARAGALPSSTEPEQTLRFFADVPVVSPALAWRTEVLLAPEAALALLSTQAAPDSGSTPATVAPPTSGGKVPATSRAKYVDARAGATVFSTLGGTLLGAGAGGIGGLLLALHLATAIGYGAGPALAPLFIAMSFVLLPVGGILVGGVTGLVLGLMAANIFFPPPEPTPEERAREAGRPRNTLNLSPFSTVVGRSSLEYERVLWPELSVFAAPIVLHAMLNPFDLRTGLAGNLGFRFFPGRTAPAGFFLQPQVHGESSRGSRDGSERTALGAGLAFGQSYLFGHFLLSLGLGGGMEYVTERGRGEKSWEEVETGLAFVPILRLNLGAAF